MKTKILLVLLYLLLLTCCARETDQPEPFDVCILLENGVHICTDGHENDCRLVVGKDTAWIDCVCPLGQTVTPKGELYVDPVPQCSKYK